MAVENPPDPGVSAAVFFLSGPPGAFFLHEDHARSARTTRFHIFVN